MPKQKKEQTQQAENTSPKKKPGRRPMTSKEKEEAAKVRAAERAKADNLKPEVFVQFQEAEISVDAVVEAAKADFHNDKKRTLVTAMKLYIKPEESTAYYVINEGHNGQVKF